MIPPRRQKTHQKKQKTIFITDIHRFTVLFSETYFEKLLIRKGHCEKVSFSEESLHRSLQSIKKPKMWIDTQGTLAVCS